MWRANAVCLSTWYYRYRAGICLLGIDAATAAIFTDGTCVMEFIAEDGGAGTGRGDREHRHPVNGAGGGWRGIAAAVTGVF